MNYKDQIYKFKKERNATILAHNYQLPEVQEIADFTGDSLGLSIQASKTNADIIVFCGVFFMAETAKILSPNKTVLIPDPSAGCPMADMIKADDLKKLKEQHPKAKVVCYVNSPAEVKALSDYCCTSANAIFMLKEAFTEKDEIIFVPDKYLGSYAAKIANRRVITWNGYCASHLKILPEYIKTQRKMHPNAKVLVHPECLAGSINLADEVLSTAGMIEYAKKSESEEFIVGTEIGMIYALEIANPNKKFYPASDLALCPNMKKITLSKVLQSLQKHQFEVTLPVSIIESSRKSIERMLAFVK